MVARIAEYFEFADASVPSIALCRNLSYASNRSLEYRAEIDFIFVSDNLALIIASGLMRLGLFGSSSQEAGSCIIRVVKQVLIYMRGRHRPVRNLSPLRFSK